MIRHGIWPAAALLLLGACSDGTGSGGPPELGMEASGFASDPQIFPDDDGGQSVGCLFTFSLAATGDAGATAVWTGGMLRFFLGPDRTTPFDSLALTAAEVAEAFGSGTIQAGERKSAEFGFLASVPFGMEGEFRFKVQESEAQGAAKAYVPCVVPVQEANSAPPAVSGVNVILPPGPLEPGDSIRVTWNASSTTGLWESGVLVSGAFQAWRRFADTYQKQVAHEVVLVVPNRVPLGEPVQVQVYAIDLLVRTVGALPVTTPPVTDVTPPVLTAVGVLGDAYGEKTGEYPAGSRVHVTLTALDNHALAYAVYEAGPAGALVRDSVAAGAGGPVVEFDLTLGWTGEGELRVWVRDRAGNRSAAVGPTPGGLRTYPVRSATIQEADLPGAVNSFAVSSARGQVYVASTEPALYFYSLDPLARVAQVDLPAAPLQVDVSADGGTLVARLRGTTTLSVVDVDSRRVTGVPLPNVDLVYGFAIAANGRVLVLARRTDGQDVVVEHDLATGVQRVRTDAPEVPYPFVGVAASLDRSRLLLGGGCVYRSDTDAFGPCEDMGAGRYVGGAGGALWGHGTGVVDAALQPLLSIPYPGVSALSADNRYAYVENFDLVRRVRIADGKVEDALEARGFIAPQASPDGRYLVSAANTVQVMRLP
ncbi:MAG TPA: hypothetical protein VHG08_17245 [Longimicrobium sp.]|nr:hypothetical protein [Longimicrobium sp.]